MNFFECVIWCAGQREFVEQWERLYGGKLLRREPRSGIEALVDKAAGYDQWQPSEEDMKAFMEFVWECVWTRLPPEAFEDYQPKDPK